jgi:hypothetical protein
VHDGWVFERFSTEARSVVAGAQQAARELQHNYIGTEHILLCLLGRPDTQAAQALVRLGVSWESVRRDVINHVVIGDTSGEYIPFTTHAENALQHSLREADALGHPYIGTEHLLLGMLDEPEGRGSQILVAQVGDLRHVRAVILKQISGKEESAPPAMEATQAGRAAEAAHLGAAEDASHAEEAGHRSMRIRATEDRLTLETTDPTLVELVRAAIAELGDQVDEPGTISGELPTARSLASVWRALRYSLDDIRRRARHPELGSSSAYSISASDVDHRPPRPAAAAAPAPGRTDRIDLKGPPSVMNRSDLRAINAKQFMAEVEFFTARQALTCLPGLASYARLLHPSEDYPGSPTWAEVARANGRVMHPSVQWDKISSPAQQEIPGQRRPMTPWTLEALCAILARHTATPQTCYFAVSRFRGFTTSTITANRPPDGGVPEVEAPKPPPAEWQLDESGPTFSLPHHPPRNYYLFEGHVGDAVRIGRWANERRFDLRMPDFIWPADHTWCVASTPFLDSTFIGGSGELVVELCASEAIEVFQFPPDAPIQDRVNI